MNKIKKNIISIENESLNKGAVVIANKVHKDYEFVLTKEEILEGLLIKIAECGLKSSEESVKGFYNQAHDYNIGSLSTKIIKEVVRLDGKNIKILVFFWNGTPKDIELQTPSVKIYSEKEIVAKIDENIKVNLKSGEVKYVEIKGELEQEIENKEIWAGF